MRTDRQIFHKVGKARSILPHPIHLDLLRHHRDRLVDQPILYNHDFLRQEQILHSPDEIIF